MQARWRDGVFAEIAHWPAACVTPLSRRTKDVDRTDRAAKLIVPFGGCNARSARRHTIIVNGAPAIGPAQ